MTAAFAAALGVYFTSQSLDATRAQNTVAQQGQLTDRFTKAVDQLDRAGADHLQARLGAIYALERLARDSPRDQPTITEVLTAFIRTTTPKLDFGTETADHGPCPEQEHSAADIQAALTVLGRRNTTRDPTNPINLHTTCLGGADLRGADLNGANLNHAFLNGALLNHAVLVGADLGGAFLDGAGLVGANLDGANLDGTRLNHAYLSDAVLRHAVLNVAFLHGAYLDHADLSGAVLDGAFLDGAFFSGAYLDGAFLRDADLRRADLDHADLRRADLRYANLGHTNLRGADFRGADLSRADLRDAQHDGHTEVAGVVAEGTHGLWW